MGLGLGLGLGLGPKQNELLTVGPIHTVQGSDGNGIVVSEVDIKEVRAPWMLPVIVILLLRPIEINYYGGRCKVSAPIALT